MTFTERFITYDEELDGNLYTIDFKDQNGALGRIDFKKDSLDVEIVFIYVEKDKRRKGIATKMLTNLSERYNVIWDGRFTKEGRQLYENWNKKN